MKYLYKKSFFIFILFLIVFSFSVFAMDNPRDRLDKIRLELDSLAHVLDNYRADESSLNQKIAIVDQKISARRRLIRELGQQKSSEEKAVKNFDSKIRSNNRHLGKVRKDLANTTDEVQNYTDLIIKRAVFTYKHGGRETLRFLSAANNPGELFRRQLYVRRIQARDAKNLNTLRSLRNRQDSEQKDISATIKRLSNARAQKAEALKNIEKLISETNSERAYLQKDRTSFNKLLVNVKRDRQTVEKQIEDRKAAMKQVENWIASLERKRISGNVQEIRVSNRSSDAVVRKVNSFSSFTKTKGKLPWPVKGRVTKRFGLERNSTTGTLTDNPGIDIRAKKGEEVLSVQKGICTRITYLRGFGTTVLIDHNDGYYTVYAHLDEIWISEGESVEAGRVIGTVGTSGGIESPLLHFQVWHKREKQDPLKWLKS